MNRTSTILGLVIAVASSAASAESFAEYNVPFVSSLSRAAVQTDVGADRKAPNVWATSYNPLAQFRGDNSREQVSAEYIAQRDLVSAFTGEDSGSAYLAGRPAAAGETRLAGKAVLAR